MAIKPVTLESGKVGNVNSVDDITAQVRQAVQAARAEAESADTTDEYEEVTEEQPEQETMEALPDIEASGEDAIAPTVEDEARELGWKPEDEFEGDPERWVSAKEFLQRDSFFKRIDGQKKQINTQSQEIQALKKALKTLTELNKATKLKEIEESKATIKSKKRDAFESQDFESFEKAEAEMASLHEEEKLVDGLDDLIEDPVEDSNKVDPAKLLQHPIAKEAFDKFERLSKDWFNKDAAATAVANATSTQVFNSTQGSPEEKLKASLDAALLAVRKRFPEYFKNPMKSAPAAVGKSTSKGGETPRQVDKRKTGLVSRMTAQERSIMKNIIADTGMTEEAYLEAYQKA